MALATGRNDGASSDYSYRTTSASSFSSDQNDNQYTARAAPVSSSSSLHFNCSNDRLITPMVIGIFDSHTFQVIMYFILLIYLFLGVAIVSDIFMCAIERITSSTKTVRKVKTIKRCPHSTGAAECTVLNCEGTDEVVIEETQVKIWNDTVANLTLMALGSSSPEILLSIIEVISSGFKAGDLGAGTIVGSAAFNLLIISAACISSLPENVSKKIENINVYIITSFFSIFAYIWLVLTLIVISPEVIELWEAIFTFTLFIILVTTAYLADVKSIKCNSRNDNDDIKSVSEMPEQSYYFPRGCITKKSLQSFMEQVKKIDPSVSDEETVCLAVAHLFEIENHSKAFYRASVIRSMVGAPSPIPHLTPRLKLIHEALKNRQRTIVKLSRGHNDVIADSVAGDWHQLQGIFKVTINESTLHPPAVSATGASSLKRNHSGRSNVTLSDAGSHEAHDLSVIQFESPSISAYENAGYIEVKLLRSGKLTNEVTVVFKTIDHTAISNVHYAPVHQTITFKPGERVKTIKITIKDDNVFNEDRIFLSKISLPDDYTDTTVAIGDNYITVITIVDDDEPGTISFTDKIYTVPLNLNEITIPVIREKGYDGRIKVKYAIIDGTAINGKHYQCYSIDNCLSLPHGAKEGNIIIQLLPDDKRVNNDCELFFEINLTSCYIEKEKPVTCIEGGRLEPQDREEEEEECAYRIGRNNKAVIVLTNNNDVNTTKLLSKINEARDGFRLNASVWKDQLLTAVSIKLTDEDNKLCAWLLHIITFHWKILFALIPPINIWRGWLTFMVSLILIGILTAIIGDIATTVGCLININPSLNAITFVAMGTSMPDLFASVTAIRMDSSADNAIGNITGSNSVNVFLGLGLPWMLASIYWSFKGKQFSVPTGDIIFCVALYTIIAVIAITLLAIRRYSARFGSGEVGGPKKLALASSFILICLWILYITLSALSLYNVISF